MKFLVTGGAGFIGSHLVETLIKQGNQVRILDNLSTGKRKNLHPKAEFIEADIRNLDQTRPAFVGIDGVFHVAALPRVQASIANPLECNGSNIDGTLNVIWAAKEAGVKKIVYSASSSAYGDSKELPLKETMKSDPISPYALQKYVGEVYMKLAAMFWGLETVSLRYFNVFGPNMAAEGAYVTVIAIFNRQKLNNQPLTATGDGEQTRDFTYVDDVIRANLLAMASTKVGQGEVINIGNSDNRSVNYIAKVIGGPVEHIAARVEPRNTLADTSKAKELIGWQPQVSFDEGLKRTIKWYQDNANEFITRK
ncbi:MAG: NAD-dependent epimerase/dehydratase family protein [Patescibacteria group bacterium]|nr:NAD-dependent epimerase/dehydratase family protein [Patescibacteria group bacterium]